MMSKKAFTLIEVLIVVAIIAVLASVVLVGLGPTQRIGRDARRISDLRQVQSGLELYFNKCGYYPGVAQPNSPCTSFSAISSWGDLTNALTGSNIGVTNIPNDPSAGQTYVYATDQNGTSYVLRARLEDANNSSLASDVDGTVDGVDCGDSPVPYYCIQF